MVEPCTAAPLATLVVVKLANEVTEIAAVAVKALVPSDVVSEPGAMVLVNVPPSELVTTTVMVQVEACGIKVPEGRDSEPAPGAADAAPALQPVVVTDGVPALTNPVG